MGEPAIRLPARRPRHLRVVREAAASRARAGWLRVRLAGRAAWAARAVTLHALAIIAGWALFTAGIAPVVAWWGFDVWPLSAGALLLSVAGWGHLRVLFTAGLYHLTRKPR